MAKTEKRKIGDLGEDVVCRHLRERGCVILDRNYLKPWGEIDVVAFRNDVVHFVEVKTVTREPGQEIGVRPEENMHQSKIERLHRAIQSYLSEKPALGNCEFQLDLACVYLDIPSRRAHIRLIENIVL